MGKYEERVRKFGANDGIIGEAQAADTEIERFREALSNLQAWVTDGGYEEDPDVAYMCGEARQALKGENHD